MKERAKGGHTAVALQDLGGYGFFLEGLTVQSLSTGFGLICAWILSYPWLHTCILQDSQTPSSY